MRPIALLSDQRAHTSQNWGDTALSPTCIESRHGGIPVNDDYVRHLTRRRSAEGTIRLRLFYIHKFEEWYPGELDDAVHDDIEQYLYANDAWSDNTRQSAMASLKAYYAWAHREGIISENPTRDLPPIHVHRRRPRIASEEAIRQAIQCDRLIDRAMIMLGAECGLRVSEIAKLDRSDRDDEWLHLIGKGNILRTVHLSPELAELLDTIETTTMRHEHYFPGQSGLASMHPSTAWRHITDVLKSNPHSLRRRAGTVVYRNSGYDIRLAQVFLGHKMSTTTEMYLDVQDVDLARAGKLTRIAA